MRYQVQVEGDAVPVEVRPLADGRVAVAMAGDDRIWRVARLPGDTWLLHDEGAGEVHPVGLGPRAGPSGPAQAICRGSEAQVAVRDLAESARLRASAARAAEGPVEVRCPMPGRVAAVLVEEGETVAAGQPLLLVEAMKMENEVRASRAGRVRDLAARPGDCPEAGTLLCTIG